MSGTGRGAAALAALAAVALGAIAAGVFTLAYDTNDDPLMALLAAGVAVAQEPEEHLVNTHVLVGRALASLHRWRPLAPWYGRYLLAVHVLAAAGLAFAVLRRRADGRGLALLALYLASVGLYFVTRLQFTTAAFAAAQAGVLLWLASLADGDTRWRRGLAATAAGLLVLASMVRLESFALALVLALPAGLAGLRRAGPGRRARAVVAPALAVAAAAGLFAYDRAAYTGEWAAFLEFDDTLRVAELRRQARRRGGVPVEIAGGSENDRRLAARWFHVDDALAALAPLAWTAPREDGAEARPPVARPVMGAPMLGACALLLLPALLWGTGTGGRGLAVLGGTLLLAAAIAGALVLVGRPPPPRVAVPLASFPLALALVLPGPGGGRRRAADVLALAAGLLAAGGALALIVQLGRDARARQDALDRSLAELRAAPDTLIVAWAARFPYEAIPPLAPLHALAGLRVVPIGWPLRTPPVQRTLRDFGAEDLPRALYRRDDLLLVSSDALNRLYVTYVREHHGLEVECRVHARLPSFVVYKIVPGTR